MSEEINNPLYKLTTDKMPPLLFNVLIRFVNTEVLQGTIATHIRYYKTANIFLLL